MRGCPLPVVCVCVYVCAVYVQCVCAMCVCMYVQCVCAVCVYVCVVCVYVCVVCVCGAHLLFESLSLVHRICQFRESVRMLSADLQGGKGDREDRGEEG